MEGADQHSLYQWCRYGLYNDAHIESAVAPPLVRKEEEETK